MALELVPFEAGLLDEAGALLAAQHRRHRAALPGLPERFESPAAARAAVQSAWAKPLAGGWAARRDGRLAAYLIGDRLMGEVWGRAGWVGPAGCAVAEGEHPQVVQDLYARLGQQWVDWGLFSHFTLVSTADAGLVQAWFELSFGCEQVHALLDVQVMALPAPPEVPGVTFRLAGPGDEALLAEFSDVIWRHQVQAPVWGVHLPEHEAETRAGWAELATDASARVWLALAGGRVVGSAAFFPAEPAAGSIFLPEGAWHLSVVGTHPAERGRGVGLALTRLGLAQLRAEGIRWCDIDWRSTNLLAARFWPRQGFRPVAYRLARRVDHRIAWANGRASA